MYRSLWIRLATFLVWLLAAGCAVYWALQFVSRPLSPVSATVATPAPGIGTVDAQALAKGLGGGQVTASSNATDITPPPSALQAARFQLTGVVVNKSPAGQGLALIAVDGKPPRPYRVGTGLTDGVVLHSVAAGKAMLATTQDAAPSLTLELPQQTSAVVGTAIASRPLISTTPPTPPATPTPAPAAAAPTPTAPTPTAPPPAASPAATPMPVPGQKPPRLGANRQRGVDREARTEAQDAAPAQ
jgi:general secretion pathway protein C